jgi:hypothetical protein
MKLPGHKWPLDVDHCEWCRLYHTDERYRSLVDVAEIPRPQIDQQKCIHEGEEIPSSKLEELGLRYLRVHIQCARGFGTIPGIACKCDQCTAACAGFVAAGGGSDVS